MSQDLSARVQSDKPLKTDQDYMRALRSGEFDFLDFGCSGGGSIGLAKLMFGDAKGLGLDIDPAKVEKARQAGHDAMVSDLTNLAVPHKTTRFVMACHFLEHLPGLKFAERALTSAVRAAQEFVYVAQPWFDSDGYLFQRGLKIYWSDWHGHPNRMTSYDFHYILEPMRRRDLIAGYRIFGDRRIKDSRHASIHPLASLRNQHDYDPSIHPPKPKRKISFKETVMSEIQVLIDLKRNDSFAGYKARYPNSECLFSSYD